MPRSRRDDDREYERELARQRAKRDARREAEEDDEDDRYSDTGNRKVTGGFGFGFSATLGCFFALFCLFCVLPMVVWGGGCFAAKQALDAAAERKKEKEMQDAAAAAAVAEAAERDRAERERLQLAREAEAKRMAAAIAVGEMVQVTAVAPIGATREVLQTLLKATAENNERELLKLAEARTTSRLGKGDRCSVLAIAAELAQIRVAEGANAGDWWIESRHLAHIPRKIE